MSDDELALLLVDVVRDWLKHVSDGWYRLDNFLDAMQVDIPDGRQHAEFEQRVYAQLDKWDAEARHE